MDRRFTGFTLIEVLVVVAIIGLLVAILMPSLIKARLAGQRAACMSNLKQVGLGMITYTQDNKGWLPLGPVDQLYWMNIDDPPSSPRYSSELQTGSGWRAFLYLPWQWGGHRAAYKYLTDENNQPIDETLPRPLTRYIYRSATLDSKTPAFECPSDKGLDYWDRVEGHQDVDGSYKGGWGASGLGRRPVHEMVGNSYVVYCWGRKDYTRHEIQEFKRTPDQVAMAMEAVMYFDARYANPASPADAVRQSGWHGQERTYNVLSLDMHCEYKFLDLLYGGMDKRAGYRIKFVDFSYIADYYR